MEEKTLEALKESIENWKLNSMARHLYDIKMGPRSCALCQLFHPNHSEELGCCGCPVREKTGQPFCRDTPYREALFARDLRDLSAFREAANKEVLFLESLLPKEKTND